jgi:hypothetical protein
MKFNKNAKDNLLIYSALNSTFGTVLFHLKGTSFLNENR